MTEGLIPPISRGVQDFAACVILSGRVIRLPRNTLACRVVGSCRARTIAGRKNPKPRLQIYEGFL